MTSAIPDNIFSLLILTVTLSILIQKNSVVIVLILLLPQRFRTNYISITLKKLLKRPF
jgi:hypothetical protein